MATTFTYDDKAIRESLLDLVVNIDPVETTLYSSLQKSSADQPFHQWLVDTLAAVGANAQIEGADPAFANRTNPTRKSNMTQIVRKDFLVSESDKAANTAGFKDRYAYEMQKAMKEWKRDTELALLRGSLISGTGSAARQLAGVKAQVTTLVTSQSGVSLSEATLNSYLQNAWAQGGEVDTVLVGGTLKRRISGFTANNTRFVQAQSNAIDATINVYDSDFGRIEVAKHRYATIAGDVNFDIYGIQKDKWAVAHLRDPKYVEVPRTGDASKGYIIGELTLEGRAENSSFVATAHL